LELTNFYNNLLPFDAIPDFYIRGYTETLSFFKSSVKIVTESRFSDVPYKLRRYFFRWDKESGNWYDDKLTAPFYFIPINKGKESYGFILKGQDKLTSSMSTWLRCFNLDALFGSESYIVGVEGIKDCYPFISRGHPTIAVLTNKPSKDILEAIKLTGKKFIYIADNDSDKAIDTGSKMRTRLKDEMNHMKMRFVLPELPSYLGDTGEWADSEEKRLAVEKFVDKVEGYI
jgi:hypothetical protein